MSGERLVSMDFARGIAILGIIYANVAAFSGPNFTEALMSPDPEHPWLSGLVATFVSGKFRGMLALLFGAGMAMQYQKSKFFGIKWPNAYAKRMALLAGIGLLHGLFLWPGDILLLYGLCGLIAMLFMPSPAKTRTLLGFGGIVISLGFILLFGAMIAWKGPDIVTTADFNPAVELAAMEGTWLDRLTFRATMTGQSLLSLIAIGPEVIGLFLLGSVIGEHGFYRRNGDRSEKVTKWGVWAWSIGLVTCAAMAVIMVITGNGFGVLVTETFFAAILAFAYLDGAVRTANRAPESRLVDMVQRVGRMALTCYLLQTVISTTIFYKWGLGLYNQTNLATNLIIATLVNLIIIAIAGIWTRAVGQGPVEWVWRKLAAPSRQKAVDAA